MKKIRTWLLAGFIAAICGGTLMGAAVPQTASAACDDRLLTFPTWYRGLVDGSCNVKNPNDVGGLLPFFFKLGLNIVEFILQLVGYLAVGYIIYGGFKYIIASGEASGIVSARKIIFNAVIGLLISLGAVGIVNLIALVVKQ